MSGGKPGRGRVWSDEEISRLREMSAARATNAEMAKALGRSIDAVASKRTELGLVAPPLGTRRKAGRKPSTAPSRSRVVTRPEKTVGGKGARLERGQLYDGNLPNCSLTDEIFDTIVDLVEAGNFRRAAARAAGVYLPTFDGWCADGRQHIEDFREGTRVNLTRQAQLVLALDRAEGRSFTGEMAIIHGSGDVKDRTLRFAVVQKRHAKEWAVPATAIDDATGKQTETDIMDLLVSRLQALKDASP